MVRKEDFIMKKFISATLLALTKIILVACSSQNKQSLDGDYYWISSERNELAFPIKESKGTIQRGEADTFTINESNNTFELSGNDNSTVKYVFKNDTISTNLTGTERTYYKKDSKAYNKALKENGYN